MFNRFTSNNVEPNNKDSLVFTIETTDKNSSIKERHLPYNQLLLRSDANEKDEANRKNENNNSSRRGTNSENEQSYKTFSDRDGAKTRKRPQFLLGR